MSEVEQPTPGPLEVAGDSVVTIARDGQAVAYVEDLGDETLPTAYRMAACEDLLAACDRLVRCATWREPSTKSKLEKEALKQARAAIRKANHK